MEQETIRALRDYLEGLEYGSRQLSDRVLLATGWEKTIIGHFFGPMYSWTDPATNDSYVEQHRPNPTLMVDDALKLQGAEDLLEDALSRVRQEGWIKGKLSKTLAKVICEEVLTALIVED